MQETLNNLDHSELKSRWVQNFRDAKMIDYTYICAIIFLQTAILNTSYCKQSFWDRQSLVLFVSLFFTLLLNLRSQGLEYCDSW